MRIAIVTLPSPHLTYPHLLSNLSLLTRPGLVQEHCLHPPDDLLWLHGRFVHSNSLADLRGKMNGILFLFLPIETLGLPDIRLVVVRQ